MTSPINTRTLSKKPAVSIGLSSLLADVSVLIRVNPNNSEGKDNHWLGGPVTLNLFAEFVSAV